MAGKGKVGIVGSGFIGRGWAMLFASVGYEVKLFDVESSKIDDALADIKLQLNKLEESGYLRGNLSATEQFHLISKCETLKECVEGSIHVQECVFENVDLKKKVFKDMDPFASNDVVLCSSTSCFPASSFSEDLVHRSQVIVGHPVNPPYYVPLVEIVPAPWTDPDVVTRTKNLMIDIGQKPVVLNKEVPGFALNRVQYALLNECWRMYRDGMLDYCNRYGQGIYKVSDTFGPNPRMEGELAEKVHEEICKISPLEKLAERRQWRDARLTALAHMKRILNEQDKSQ
ncbi:Lambda-crystallin like protein [Argiope bruennichi]|uniref:Lambda-crystallin like protein n=1 Tax=Argiope bruennichi TaxID=94029 RepID=A0A8T0EW74_ARGBR|nr:Lambda-crystallin like protein [Argiope bruennichi]